MGIQISHKFSYEFLWGVHMLLFATYDCDIYVDLFVFGLASIYISNIIILAMQIIIIYRSISE